MTGMGPKLRQLSSGYQTPKGVEATPVTEAEIPYLHAFVSEALGPGIASIETVRRVHAHQRFALWKVRNGLGNWTGAYALLYLNDQGLEAVTASTFNSLEPNLAHLAERPSEVKAIFAWCLVLRGKSKAALLQAASWIETCGWSDCPVFTNPVTPRGSGLAIKLGFERFDMNADNNIHVVY